MTEMGDFRLRLLQDPYCLAVDEVKENIIWRRVGRSDILVTKESAITYDKAIAEEAAEGGAEGDTGSDQGAFNKPELEPAALTFVATISPDDFWLTPCGYWKGPSRYVPTLADLKLNCRLVAPTEPFAEDFKTVVKNLKSLIADIEIKGNDKQGIFDKESAIDRIRVRHVVFEPLGDDDDLGGFRLRDWPVRHEAARIALHGMVETHRVFPIAAYNMDGDLIPPSKYASALKGAVVRATISMEHWDIAADKKDVYTADIISFRVLVPAPPPASPRKRKQVAAKDPGPSPIKGSILNFFKNDRA
ncbi:hypothetical protein C8R44DRAFT_762714 [Mycena epipterygia]|nr:hypothetical protein C8R44DRAFT_762714 [Mycena epipterygia]